MTRARWGWFIAAVTLLAAGNVAYEFAVDQRWTSMMILGIGIPLGALLDWYYLRRRSEDARVAADRGLAMLLLMLLWIGIVAEGAPECPPTAARDR